MIHIYENYVTELNTTGKTLPMVIPNSMREYEVKPSGICVSRQVSHATALVAMLTFYIKLATHTAHYKPLVHGFYNNFVVAF